MHHLLQSIRFCNIQCTHGTIQALLANYRRTPQDLTEIFFALHGIGRNHANFVEYLVEDLLKLDHKFIAIEAKVTDIHYISFLIVICSAAEINPNILSLLPSYTYRHYCYLKDKYPLFFPQSLRFPRDNNLFLSFPSSSLSSSSSSSMEIDEKVKEEDKMEVEGAVDKRGWVNKMEEFFEKCWLLLPSLLPSPPNFELLSDHISSYNMFVLFFNIS